ncbi:MAG: OmpH family outer membrane protein [Alphaproteobacteria bacterium]|nr:OmpH family outer membrane protein [Alphaproteobacteria bacterium]
MRAVTFACLLILALIPIVGPAEAQPLPQPVVMVIDTDRILKEATVMKNVREQLDKIRTSYQGEITKEEDELRRMDQELGQQRQLLSQEASQQRRQELQQRASALQVKARTRRRQLDQAEAGAMQKVRGVLVEITRALMTERGANVVVPRGVLLALDERLDSTAEALKRLNVQLPATKVEVPKG